MCTNLKKKIITLDIRQESQNKITPLIRFQIFFYLFIPLYHIDY